MEPVRIVTTVGFGSTNQTVFFFVVSNRIVVFPALANGLEENRRLAGSRAKHGAEAAERE